MGTAIIEILLGFCSYKNISILNSKQAQQSAINNLRMGIR
jgi:hypothetical protein